MDSKLSLLDRSETYLRWGIVALVFMCANCVFGLKWLRQRQVTHHRIRLLVAHPVLLTQILRDLPSSARHRRRPYSRRLVVPPPDHARLGLRRRRHLGRRARLPSVSPSRLGRGDSLLPPSTGRQGAGRSPRWRYQALRPRKRPHLDSGTARLPSVLVSESPLAQHQPQVTDSFSMPLKGSRPPSSPVALRLGAEPPILDRERTVGRAAGSRDALHPACPPRPDSQACWPH